MRKSSVMDGKLRDEIQTGSDDLQGLGTNDKLNFT